MREQYVIFHFIIVDQGSQLWSLWSALKCVCFNYDVGRGSCGDQIWYSDKRHVCLRLSSEVWNPSVAVTRGSCVLRLCVLAGCLTHGGHRASAVLLKSFSTMESSGRGCLGEASHTHACATVRLLLSTVKICSYPSKQYNNKIIIVPYKKMYCQMRTSSILKFYKSCFCSN